MTGVNCREPGAPICQSENESFATALASAGGIREARVEAFTSIRAAMKSCFVAVRNYRKSLRPALL